MLNKMDAYAWRKEFSQKYEYKIQINNIKHGDKKTYSQIFKEWEENGWGWKSDSEFRILTRTFKDEKEWIQWAKVCPIKIIEVKYRSGREVKIQRSCKKRKKREKNEKI